MSVQDWNTTAANNNAVGAINIAEGCPAANLNNAIREVMAQVKAFSTGLGSTYQAKDGALTSLAGLTGSNNKVPIFTGAETLSTITVTDFIKTLLDDNSADAACNTIGAVRVAALSLGNPGYIRFVVGGSSFFQVAWGSISVPANSALTVSYASPFNNASFPVASGTVADGTAEDNTIGVLGGTVSKTGFQAFNGYNSALSGFYIAVGY